ncbi:hypothetical protein TWF718_008407 [Orbilia javanica]|uniref:Uncharacterized protein n=1 Tax=Orbilia javanica TaxID=47235 RepID=A0AAN8RHN4_9PEZI
MVTKKVNSDYPRRPRGASPHEESNSHSLVVDITDHPNQTLFTDPGRGDEVCWEVNRTVEDIFRVGRVSGGGSGGGLQCPLVYESHSVKDRDGRTFLKLEIKAAINNPAVLSDIITDFCEKLFTEEGLRLLDRVSYAGIFGISPRQGSVFERIWVTTFAARVLNERGRLERIGTGLTQRDSTLQVQKRWFINICYVLSIIYGPYQFGFSIAELVMNYFGVHTIWYNSNHLSFDSGSLPSWFVFWTIRITLFIDFIMVCAALFGFIYAIYFEARVRDKDLYERLEMLEWRKYCEDAVRATKEVVSCLQQRQPDPTVANPPIDYTLGTRLSTLLHLLSNVHHKTQEAANIHDQIQRKDQSLSKLLFVAAGISSTILTCSWKLTHILPDPHGRICLYTVVAGFISIGLFTASGVYVAVRAVVRRMKAGVYGDVDNKILDIWKVVQRNYSFLIWIYATNHGVPNFIAEEPAKQWGEWVEDINSNVNNALNAGFLVQLVEFSRYLGKAVQETSS